MNQPQSNRPDVSLFARIGKVGRGLAVATGLASCASDPISDNVQSVLAQANVDGQVQQILSHDAGGDSSSGDGGSTDSGSSADVLPKEECLASIHLDNTSPDSALQTAGSTFMATKFDLSMNTDAVLRNITIKLHGLINKKNVTQLTFIADGSVIYKIKSPFAAPQSKDFDNELDIVLPVPPNSYSLPAGTKSTFTFLVTTDPTTPNSTLILDVVGIEALSKETGDVCQPSIDTPFPLPGSMFSINAK